MTKDFEKIVSDLKNIFSFKETTGVGDIVLIVADHLLYALVTHIERDRSRRDEWWHLSMQLLTIPPQPVTWTLREPQFTGQEIFTMGGDKRFIKAVSFPGPEPSASPEEPVATGRSPGRPRLTVVK